MKERIKLYLILLALVLAMAITGCDTPVQPQGIQPTWKYSDTTGVQP